MRLKKKKPLILLWHHLEAIVVMVVFEILGRRGSKLRPPLHRSRELEQGWIDRAIRETVRKVQWKVGGFEVQIVHSRRERRSQRWNGKVERE